MEFSAQGRLIPDQERTFEAGREQRGYFRLHPVENSLELACRRRPEDFDNQNCQKLAEKLREIAQSCGDNILSGTHLPFRLGRAKCPFGTEFKEDFWPMMAASFETAFPGQEVRDKSRIAVADAAELDPTSTWRRLVERREAGDVLGWYFPEALAGYAIPDMEKACARISPRAHVSGLSEIAYSLALFPELLHPPGHYGRLLAVSGLRPLSASEHHMFWFFEAYGFDLTFNCRSKIGAVSEYYSGGVTFLVD